MVCRMYRRACCGEGEVQGHRRRPRHCLRGAHPQGISAVVCFRSWLWSLRHVVASLTTARDSNSIRIDVFLLYILYS